MVKDEVIFVPYMNADQTEGRGATVPCCIGSTVIGCTSIALAEAVVHKKDRVFGSDPDPKHYTIKPCRVITAIDDLHDLDETDRKQKALAKLTDEDKILLGLK
jgi:hypothetical protein